MVAVYLCLLPGSSPRLCSSKCAHCLLVRHGLHRCTHSLDVVIWLGTSGKIMCAVASISDISESKVYFQKEDLGRVALSHHFALG